MNEAQFSRPEPALIKLQAFVVTKTPTIFQLRACVFSRSEDVQTVLSGFGSADIELLSIWNYNPDLFFRIPHLTSQHYHLGQSSDHKITSQLWSHSDNDWIRDSVKECTELMAGSEYEKPRGSILADDMGLGKTLTALMFILATSQSAHLSQRSRLGNSAMASAATLIVCPLATLSNWENEIQMHFQPQTITYCVFHGRNRGEITHDKLISSMVVLTTYEMIGKTGNSSTSLPTIESLNICWFRIVLDEAHMIRNRSATRTQLIQRLDAKFFLCLTGTPLQNRLTDLQSLFQLLKMKPWSEEWIWSNFLIPNINVGSSQAIKSLNRLMDRICLRRTKDVLLNLPPKTERAVVVHLSSDWQKISHELHQTFVQSFGRLRTSADVWNSGEFFRQLKRIRQFCNHPLFAREEIEFDVQWEWNHSAKAVHLIDKLKNSESQGSGSTRPKSVIFSSYVGFLEIIENGLRANSIQSTWLTGKMSISQRDESLAIFRGNTDCNVLLGSIAAAGVGIDLRCAEHVYIMEPSWNPAMEAQAIDRLYRLGQVKPVNVYRYYVHGTLETNIYQIQRRKGELAM
ncbi:hypothetical protein PGT21_026639 [Puccinia graminis f. sp. tritici]|uniref:Uncharacterized protein n=1 Tax=Puccinia graminis f. sp. tritici TaxID=56615 RepID=A0A5B0NTG0_PUCGR|nr:hypothetical protein PGTUg99_009346 [Puccinia graminis f. sp. tritici]KAA1091138.1 hypothetical protein PGT21_026639 [Puccinia graminis f. sp. tritici]